MKFQTLLAAQGEVPLTSYVGSTQSVLSTTNGCRGHNTELLISILMKVFLYIHKYFLQRLLRLNTLNNIKVREFKPGARLSRSGLMSDKCKSESF